MSTHSLAALEARVHEFQLDNGWRFLILPRGLAPVTAFHTFVAVGAVHERPGITGMAHMFEHMAFKGSDRVGTRDWALEKVQLEAQEKAWLQLRATREGGQPEAAAAALADFERAGREAARLVDGEAFTRVLEQAGGASTLNASTSAEETRYMVSLPSERAELWCWMERERFTRPVLREFYVERSAVQEERRMRVDSSPPGALYERLLAEAFRVHPYGRPVVGFAPDLERFSRSEAEAFFREHYGAGRMVSAIVGAVDPERLRPMLERYFSDLSRGTPACDPPPEPEQTEERSLKLSFPAAPRLVLAWKVPAMAHPDNLAVELAVRVLGWGRSSRLDRRLVERDGTAAAVAVGQGLPGERWENLALVTALPSPGVECARLEAAIEEELELLAKDGPRAEELAGVKLVVRMELLRSMRSSAGLAALLCEYSSKVGRWQALFERVEALDALSAADVQRAVGRYFQRARRTRAELERRPKASALIPVESAN